MNGVLSKQLKYTHIDVMLEYLSINYNRCLVNTLIRIPSEFLCDRIRLLERPVFDAF